MVRSQQRLDVAAARLAHQLSCTVQARPRSVAPAGWRALPASITFIGEVGHLMMLEQPQAFAQEIAWVLNRGQSDSRTSARQPSQR